jgi:hypothetical protein
MYRELLKVSFHPSGDLAKGWDSPRWAYHFFSDSAESVVDVFKTVFHELFHHGSKVRFTKNVNYIQTMLDIADWQGLRHGYQDGIRQSSDPSGSGFRAQESLPGG